MTTAVLLPPVNRVLSGLVEGHTAAGNGWRRKMVTWKIVIGKPARHSFASKTLEIDAFTGAEAEEIARAEYSLSGWSVLPRCTKKLRGSYEGVA